MLVVVLAGFLRLDGLRWDDGSLPHPDERYLTMLVSAVHSGKLAPAERGDSVQNAHLAACVAQFPQTQGVGGWFATQCSDFNPANVGYAGYPYGQFPLFLVRLLGDATSQVTGRPEYAQYGGIHLVGRALSASADILTLLILFLLGRLLWGRSTGVLAAGFYAMAVLPIQTAHFWTVDSVATLFASMSLLFAVRIVRFGDRGDAVAFGAAWALAVSSKISLAPLILLLPLAAFLARSHVAFAIRPDWLTRASTRLPIVLLGCVGAIITFRISSPYAFAGPSWHDMGLSQALLDQIRESQRLASGVVDIPPNWQWLGRAPWLWAVHNLTLWGLGIALGLAAFIGLARRGWRLLRASPIERARAIPWLWLIGYLVWMGYQWVASMRYFLPIYPLLCLFAAAWLVPWWRARRLANWRATGGVPVYRANGPAAIAIVVLASTALWAVAFHQVHTTLHPYVAATHWIIRNIAAPVSAQISTSQNTPVLLNWPAHGDFGDGVPARVATATVAPASGTIDRLSLHTASVVRASPALSISARILNAEGIVVATTHTVNLLQATSGRDVAQSDLSLVLREPLKVIGGQVYRLQIEVGQGTISLAGSRIAHEGAWNDPIPARVPRLAASEVFDLDGPSGTVPLGAANVDPFGEGYYVPIDLMMTTDDDAAKRVRLISQLDKAEWLVIPNNRFYDSMQRNPLRFPLSTRFYNALFSGELGFSRFLVVGSLPRIAGLSVDDQSLSPPGQGVTAGRPWQDWAAEEAFSVYDHPTVYIFRKTNNYSNTGVERILSQLNLTTVDAALGAEKPVGAGRLNWSTHEASKAADGLLRTMNAQADEAPSPTQYPPASAWTTAEAVITWYGFSLLLGWMAWPWLALVFPTLPDRGYGVAKIAGLAAVAGTAWWLTWLGFESWSGHGVAMVLLIGVGTTVPVARRMLRRERGWLRLNWRYLGVSEGLFLALFALGLVLRGLDPDLWAPVLGGEKPMDYALFNSVLASSEFPPPDPWLSGTYLNYYYFGWVLVGVLTKLTGVVPAIAYNIALPTWWAMTGIGAFSVAWNACAGFGGIEAYWRRRWLAGVIALVAAVILGNLDLPRAVDANIQAVKTLITRAEPMDVSSWREALTQRSERWLWAPSRTVGERENSSFEVNEFPAFTFLYGDLHPHLMAWPLQIFLLTALLGLAMPLNGSVLGASSVGWALTSKIAVVAVGLALLRATNSWDWPPYLFLACLASGVAGWRYSHGHQFRWPQHKQLRYHLALAGLVVIALVAAQAILALPFSTTFMTGGIRLRLYEGNFTALSAWIATTGWFLLVIGGWAGLLSRESCALPLHGAVRSALKTLIAVRWAGIGYTALWIAFVAYRGSGEVAAIGLQFSLIAWLMELLWRNRHCGAISVGLLTATFGFGLELVVEFVVLGQDLGRMNTYFKVYLQAWILLAIASGIATAGLVEYGLPQRRNRLYAGLLGVASLLASAYLPLATYGRSQTRFDPSAAPTLDGEAFLASAIYEYNGNPLKLADDQRLIAWLRVHAGRDDVIAEAQLPEYRWGSRISTFTGRPTILGYRYHEAQQHPVAAFDKVIELRKKNVEALYTSTDPQTVWNLLQHYEVRYIVVGGLERITYPKSGLEKFKDMVKDNMLETAFKSGNDVIYRSIDQSKTGSTTKFFKNSPL
jgi:YYY domain-containing protein